MRVITDNDFAGDPDGLFQLAHLLLSHSVETRAIIGSHLNATDGFDRSGMQAANAVKKVKELLDVMGIPQDSIPVIQGSNVAMINDSTPVKSAAVDFIIKEALRTDTDLPLYVLCGAGLTEIASALLTEPRIANKLTLVWIGGAEYTDIAIPPPNFSSPEYNLNIDIFAARHIFNKSSVPIWQIPRNVYRQALISYATLLDRVKSKGKTGTYLVNALENVMQLLKNHKLNMGETYILGDSPLVLFTALQSGFEADPSSSDYVLKMTPGIDERGNYIFSHTGRTIRVYTRTDNYAMFEDFFSKIKLAR